MSDDHNSNLLTNVALPKTSATLTLRIIKSFEYRTERSLVLHNLNLETTTVGQLKDMARQGSYAVHLSPALVGTFLYRTSYTNTAWLETISQYGAW